ncbi:phosphotransferase [Mesobacillus foraminis]|uniref:Aminoglycoside 3'-phosphotransferase-2 n=1 Tax=Mesobacillus foraminis TaxID=279826 RepID=A0A4R2BGF8_9BACI|nr:phosphotransferase [Mesobacillus foraminis]TCN26127.1 aminoglycoside 3'-phosphotransferase-2 [Mesobacillus foraminis]
MKKIHSDLQKKIERVIGNISEISLLEEQGCTSIVRKIKSSKGNYLLKSASSEKYQTWLKAEALILEKQNQENLLRVPRYYGFIEEQDGCHLIMSFEEGVTLTTALKNAASKSEEMELIMSFGQLLDQLHRTNTDVHQDKNAWLDVQLKRAEGYVKLGQCDGSMELLELLKSKKPLPVKQTLIHGDCTTDNVLVSGRKVKLFIDVSGTAYGDPRYDEALAIRSFFRNEEYKNFFYEGYKYYRMSPEEFIYFNDGLYEFF